MEMEESQKIVLDFNAPDLVDGNQLSENQVDPNTNELTGALSPEREVNINTFTDVNDKLPELDESMEREGTRRSGRCNMRKSLAWDSAFFTSAGVLDPEELSSMINGADKGGKHLLPGIEEDITRSTESISTLESDNLTLENLEDDLFMDIRASIQRSSKKASDLTNSVSKTVAVEVDSFVISSLKEDFASQNEQNTKQALKKTSGQQTGRMPKCQPNQNIGKLGFGKAIKQDCGRSQTKSSARISESSSILPNPPKSVSRLIPTSNTATAKRDSMGIGRVKSKCGSSKLATVSSTGAQPPKVSVLTGATRMLKPPEVSSNSSSFGSSTTSLVQSTRSSTSSDNSSSMSSKAPAKSPLMVARRNPVKSNSVCTAPSSYITKTPSRAAPKNKPPSSSTLSAYLKSTKNSPSVSPASSISEWSSTSSSSSINQRSNNSRTNLGTSSYRSVDSDIISDPKNHSTNQTADGHKNQGITLPFNQSKKSTTQTGAIQALMKPSGLRMPSPKIGFFDGVKPLARTPNGIPKSSPTRSSNMKLKSNKVPTARVVAPISNIKPDSQKGTSLQEKPHASGSSGVSADAKDSSSLSSAIRSNTTGERCQKGGKFQYEDGVKQEVDAGRSAIIDEVGDMINEKELNMHNDMGIGDTKIAAFEGSNASGSKHTGWRDEGMLVNSHVE